MPAIRGRPETALITRSPIPSRSSRWTGSATLIRSKSPLLSDPFRFTVASLWSLLWGLPTNLSKSNSTTPQVPQRSATSAAWVGVK